MTTLVTLLRYQIEFAQWANQRALNAAAELAPEQLDHDFKTSEKTIRATLAHIYRAERLWLGRIEGAPVAFQAKGDDLMAALKTNWPLLGARWNEWSGTLTEPLAQSELSYQDLRNNRRNDSIWQIILHVVNHSTHHRGQAIGFIRALGHQPPNVDSITFARER